MVIRNALEKDAKSIVNINITGWNETYKGIFPSEFLEKLEQKRDESIVKCINKINEYIVCEVNGEVVGFLRFGKNKKNYSAKYAEIYALYIDSRYKRRGIGKKLLEYTFSNIKDAYDNVLISTLESNSATKFYEKCGGCKIGTCSFKVDNNEYTEIIYLFNL